MKNKNYLNFDLELQRAGRSYRAEVVDAPGGRASVAFGLLFGVAELDGLVASLSRGAPEAAGLVRDFGWRLFNAAFGGEVQACLARSLVEAGQQGTGLRVRLHLAQVPELAELPWEFLYYPPANSFLALLEGVTIIRYLEQAAPLKPPPVELPLRVLVVLSSPADYARFEVEQEWTRLNVTLDDLQRSGLVKLERLETASLAGLTDQLLWHKYHILHYIGHGYFDEARSEGVVVLTDEAGQGRPIGSGELGRLLNEHRSLRLAIWQACPGAITSLNDGFESTAEQLLEQGLPAALALTYATSPAATDVLLSTLYSAVAGGRELDRALSEARALVYIKGHDFEWGSSQLYLGSAEGRVFDISLLSDAEQAAVLYREAQAALMRENWPVAVQKLHEIETLEPKRPEINTLLAAATKQQELAAFYATGLEYYEAKQWQKALATFNELTTKAGPYKDVATLMLNSETAYQQQLDALELEIQTVIELEDWATARQKLNQLQTLDPQRPTAAEKLTLLETQQELAALYVNGQNELRAERWLEAQTIFQQLQAKAGPYKDVEAILSELAVKLAPPPISETSPIISESAAMPPENLYWQPSVEVLPEPAVSSYLNFDLQLEKIGQRYKATLLASPAGQTFFTFQLPFDLAYLDEFSLQLRQGGATAEYQTQDFGWQLFNAIFGSELQAYLTQSLTEAHRQDKGLRLRLHLSQVPELAALPWEFLYYPAFSTYLALLDKVAITRYFVPTQASWSLPIQLPLRVLWISAPSPEHENSTKVVDGLTEALTKLEQGGVLAIDRLENPDLTDLQQQLWRIKYHVVHLVGPAYPDQISTESAHAASQFMRLDMLQLGQLLNDCDTLRLVILQATNSGSLAQIALELVQQDFPAVLTLPFYGSSTEAHTAMLAIIYRALIEGRRLEDGLGEARNANYDKGYTLAWGAAQLHSCFGEDFLFRVAPLNQAQKIRLFQVEAQLALTRQDWAVAIAKLQELAILQPASAEMAQQLAEASRQQELDRFYKTSLQQIQAGQWLPALENLQQIQTQAVSYKDVAELIEFSNKAYRQAQLANLQQDLQTATVQENWTEVIARLEQIANLDPASTYTAQMHAARQQQQFAELYEHGLSFYQREQWSSALESFRQLSPDYRDVTKLIDEAEFRLAQAQYQAETTAKLAEAKEPGTEGASAQFVAIPPASSNRYPPIPPTLNPPTAFYPPVPPTLSADVSEATYTYLPSEPSQVATHPIQSSVTTRPKAVAQSASKKSKKVQTAPIPLSLSILWCILLGWWLGGFWLILSYVMCASLVGLPLGLAMLKRLPRILTLQPYPAARPTSPVDSNSSASQLNPVLRALYYLVVGWWSGPLWSIAGYFLCLIWLTLPSGLAMFERLPQVLTLERFAAPATPPLPPDRAAQVKSDHLTTFRLAMFVLFWLLVPTIFLLWLTTKK